MNKIKPNWVSIVAMMLRARQSGDAYLFMLLTMMQDTSGQVASLEALASK